MMDEQPPEPMEFGQREKDAIDEMSIYSMLSAWRSAPAGTFQPGDPYTEYFHKVLQEKRVADPEAWVAASKELNR